METYKCTSREYNSNMGVSVCFDDTCRYKTGFFFDYGDQVKVGDTVKLGRDKKGFYDKMLINGNDTVRIRRRG